MFTSEGFNAKKLAESRKFQISMYVLGSISLFFGIQGVYGLQSALGAAYAGKGFTLHEPLSNEVNSLGVGFAVYFFIGGTVIWIIYKKLTLPEELEEEKTREKNR